MQQADDWLGVPQVRHIISVSHEDQLFCSSERKRTGRTDLREQHELQSKGYSKEHNLFEMQTCVNTSAYTCKAELSRKKGGTVH